MESKDLITAVILVLIAVVCLIVSIMQFAEKGIPLNNAYIWQSEKKRKEMDKKPYYRQPAVVFALMSALFLFLSLQIFLSADWPLIAATVLTAVTLVYAIFSSVKMK